MKQILDFIPIALFFVAYKLGDLYLATGVLMAATTVQMAILYTIDKKLSLLHKITLGMILAFGTMTLVLHDERYIKWKPTVLYFVIATMMSVALWVYKKNILHILIGNLIEVSPAIWQRLNIAWIAYSVFMALINGYVAYAFSTDEWVNFKIWGYVFPIAFLVAQGIYLAPHIKEHTKQNTDHDDQPPHSGE